MKKRNKGKREQQKIFDILSTHYEIFTQGNSTNIFSCPLCLKEFTSQAILEERLSKSHIIPAFLKGKIYSLSCCECNNKVGTQIEGKESRRIDHWNSFFLEKSKLIKTKKKA